MSISRTLSVALLALTLISGVAVSSAHARPLSDSVSASFAGSDDDGRWSSNFAGDDDDGRWTGSFAGDDNDGRWSSNFAGSDDDGRWTNN